jgi:hypothetical protein
MSQTPAFLSSPQSRARWMRHDVAQLLKRFFFCERSLVDRPLRRGFLQSVHWKRKSAWLAFVWQGAETAHALRDRVFELRFPNRILEEQGTDHAF